LIALADRLRRGLFKGGLFIAVALVGTASPLILVVDERVTFRLMVLLVVGTLVALASSESDWCYERLKTHPWWILAPATAAALALASGGARQNATFIVIAAAFVAVPVAAGLGPGMASGVIVAAGYLLGIVLRGEPLFFEGSAGDIAGLLSFLTAIYGAYRVGDLVTMLLIDINRDHRVAAALGALNRQVRNPADSGSGAAQNGEIPGVTASEKDLNAARARTLRDLAAEAATGTPVSDVAARLSKFELTDRELDVAILAGDGLTRKQIAARLGTSPRTVEKQLRDVRGKMDAASHAEVTAIVAELLALPSTEKRCDAEA
jgi:DNA-binding CsgD family transcriptional regulator